MLRYYQNDDVVVIRLYSLIVICRVWPNSTFGSCVFEFLIKTIFHHEVVAQDMNNSQNYMKADE